GLTASLAILAVASRAIGGVNFTSLARIAGIRRGVGRKNFAAEEVGLCPRTDAANDGVDLLIGEHAPLTPRKGGHWSAGHAKCSRVANRVIVGDRKENGIAQRDRR